MNMQDYRHAADRVHIAEHCEEEVLSMTTQTEQKTRKPVLRAATGIAAAAACIGITGALGLALFHMNRDDSELTAASQDETTAVSEVTEPAASDSEPEEPAGETYEDFVSAYYEKIAGHPVDFDWSVLCGTNFNEVWESEDGVITLKAAVTDGYQAQFFYTFKPGFDWDHTDDQERNARLPHMAFNMAFGSFGDNEGFVLLDDTVREDGTLRFYRYLRADTTAEPMPEDGICSAIYLPPKHTGDTATENDMREIRINMPEQIPQWRELGSTLHLVNDGTALNTDVLEADYSYAVVTPLCVYLSDLPLAERLASHEKARGRFSGMGMPVYGGSASASAITLYGDRISVPLNLIESYDVFYGESSYQFIAEEYQEGRDPGEGKMYGICRLQFKEPLDLSEVGAIALACPAGGDAVTVDLTPEKLPFSPELDPDKAQINVVSEPAETVPLKTDGTTAQQTDAITGEQSLMNEITTQLNALTCLPGNTCTGTDGNVYYLNLSDGWVWRGNGAAQKEAKLTKELLALQKQYQAQFGLEEWER